MLCRNISGLDLSLDSTHQKALSIKLNFWFRFEFGLDTVKSTQNKVISGLDLSLDSTQQKKTHHKIITGLDSSLNYAHRIEKLKAINLHLEICEPGLSHISRILPKIFHFSQFLSKELRSLCFTWRFEKIGYFLVQILHTPPCHFIIF